MIKKFFFLAFICALIGCQKDSVQPNTKKLVSSYNKLSNSSNQKDLPVEVRDIIANGGVGHFGCEVSNNKESLGGTDGGSLLGAYAYPYTANMSPVKLYNSSLPCQPSIPYFIFSYIDPESNNIFSGGYSITFHLVLNPNYFNTVKVVDVNWELIGQNDLVSSNNFTIDGLQIGESKSLTCKVFSTDNDVTVYSQEMELDFEILLNLGGGEPVIEYSSEYTFACPSGGTFPIIAP